MDAVAINDTSQYWYLSRNQLSVALRNNFLEKSASASKEAIISPPAFESLARSDRGIALWSENISRLSKIASALNNLSRIIVVRRALSLLGHQIQTGEHSYPLFYNQPDNP